MHQLLFRRITFRHCHLWYEINLWGTDRSSWYCMADGIGRILWKLLIELTNDKTSNVKRPLNKKILQVISRILFHPPTPWLRRTSYHLSAPVIAYRDQSAYPPASDEQSSNADLCGISARKVYPDVWLLIQTVSSYLTFSPFPSCLCEHKHGRRSFSVALSVHVPRSGPRPGSSPVRCSLLSGLSSIPHGAEKR